MKDLFLVGMGGLVGAISRFVAGRCLTTICPLPGHIATLLVNATGSFVLGLVIAKAAGSAHLARWQVFLTAGFCGSFTTFSSWILDISNLAEQASLRAAAGHAFLGLLVGVAALALGTSLGRYQALALRLEDVVQALHILRPVR